jgi:serine/threonine protein kinase
MYSAGVVLGQWLHPFLPAGLGLEYLGSKLVKVSTTSFISVKLRDAVMKGEMEEMNEKGMMSISSGAAAAISTTTTTLAPTSATPVSYSKPYTYNYNSNNHSTSLSTSNYSYSSSYSSSYHSSSSPYSSYSSSPYDHSPLSSYNTSYNTSYNSHTDTEPAEAIKDSTLRLAADLLSRLLEPDPSKRITAKEALQHPFCVAGREAFMGEEHKVPGLGKLLGGSFSPRSGKSGSRRREMVFYR